jgi:hyperosmotically inducible protein
MKIAMKVLSIAVVLGAWVFPTAAQEAHKPLPDATIKTLVEHRLIEEGLQRDTNIQVSVEDQIVVLRGAVRSLVEKKQAERQANRVMDVMRVENHLVIQAPDRSDQQIADHLARAIRSFVFYDIFDWLGGQVNNGVVTLTGSVREPWRKADYERLAEGVRGVREVKNEIRVLPTSIYDDQIRVAAARSIYGHPAFRRYANRSLPPIHIVVDGGRVTLKGAVASNVERQLAESLVRTRVLTFEVINDLAVDTEMQKKM